MTSTGESLNAICESALANVFGVQWAPSGERLVRNGLVSLKPRHPLANILAFWRNKYHLYGAPFYGAAS